MQMDVVRHSIQRAFESDILDDVGFSIVWHSGEPLTLPISYYNEANKILGEVRAKYPKRARMPVSFSFQTNGTMINSEWCDLFEKLDAKVCVSVDGPAFLHDNQRVFRSGRGSHDLVVRGISLLRERHIQFSVIVVLTKNSLKYPDEIYNFLKEMGVKNVGFNIDEADGVRTESSFLASDELDHELYAAFFSRLWDLCEADRWNLAVREFDRTRWYILGGLHHAEGNQSRPFTIVTVTYDGSYSTFSPELVSVDPNGPSFVIGNVLTTSFIDAQNSNQYLEMLSEINSGISLCESQCEYFDLCGGGAPSNKLSENGTFASQETAYCKFGTQIMTDIVLTKLESIENGTTTAR